MKGRLLGCGVLALLWGGTAMAKTRVGFVATGYSSVKTSGKEDDFKSTTDTSGFSIGNTPGFLVGYELTPNIELGGSVTFASSTRTYKEFYGEAEEYEVNQKTTNTAGTVYMDYNLTPGTPMVWFAGPRLGIETITSKYEYGDYETYKVEESLTKYGVGGGLKYFWKKRVSFDTSVSYLIGTGEGETQYEDTEGPSQTLELDLTILTVSIGMSARF